MTSDDVYRLVINLYKETRQELSYIRITCSIINYFYGVMLWKVYHIPAIFRRDSLGVGQGFMSMHSLLYFSCFLYQ